MEFRIKWKLLKGYNLNLILILIFLFFDVFLCQSLNFKAPRKGKQSNRNSTRMEFISSVASTKPPSKYKGESADVSNLIDELMEGYDKRLRPNYKGDPVNVGITMHVSSVSAISEVNMDYTLDVYFRQHWRDDRLIFDQLDELCISNEMLDKIWWPDTFFANAKKAIFHPATTKNAFLRINATGWITQSLRLTVTAMCPMELALFPLDTQICSLEIESYAYSVSHITYTWKDGEKKSITLASNMQLSQFNLKGYQLHDKMENTSTGAYSRLALHICLVRDLGYYIIHLYIPSTMLVILSWISFYLHPGAAPARVALGIMTVLTMTTLISNTNNSLPKISYLKSIDVYLITCFFFVFAALVEYAAVSYLSNYIWKPPDKTEEKRGTGWGFRRVIRAAESVWPRRREREGSSRHHHRGSSGERLPLDCERVNLSFQADAISSRTAAMLYFLEANRSQMPIEMHQCSGRQAGACMYDLENGRHVPMRDFSRKFRMTNVTRLIPDVANSSPIKTPNKDSAKGGKKPEGAKEGAKKNPFARTSEAIDRYSRAVFPAAFIIFNVAYWTYYIRISRQQNVDGFNLN